VDEWADDSFDHAGLGFIGGASMHVYTERHPIEAAGMNTYGRAPLFGSAWKKFVHENAGRVASTYLQTNTFPYETTFLDLDPEVRDPLGDPVCRITSGPKVNEPRASLYASTKGGEWFRAAGAIEVVVAPGPAEGPQLSVHGVGGTRMGDDPAKNVVDKWGFSHEAPNLGIVSGSVMCTHGARNPTETIQALAWRTADHLVKSWKSIAG